MKVKGGFKNVGDLLTMHYVLSYTETLKGRHRAATYISDQVSCI